jgi:hypothetical protein
MIFVDASIGLDPGMREGPQATVSSRPESSALLAVGAGVRLLSTND